MRGSRDAHVRPTNGNQISGLAFGGAPLYDMSGEETSLRKPNYIKLPLEVWIGKDLLAGLFRLRLEILKNRSRRAPSDFDARRICSGQIRDLTRELVHSREIAAVTEPMEDGCGDRLIRLNLQRES